MQKTKQFNLKSTIKHRNYYRNFVVGCGAFLLAFIVSATFAPVKNSSAETQEVNAHIMNTDTEISVTPGQEKVTLNVGQPEPTGNFMSGSDTLTVKSTASSGYQLYVSMDNNHTNGNRLYRGGDESAGYISANNDGNGNEIIYPNTATLAKNTWGFTKSETDNNNQVYGTLPLMGNETKISEGSDPTPTAGDSVPVYYAVNVDTNMVSGDYGGTILYTIIAEADNADLGIPSINPQSGNYNTEVTISVPLKSAVANNDISDLGTITATIGGETCVITNTVLGGATVNLTCNVPALALAGSYSVEVYIQKYDSTFTATNAFYYSEPVTLADIKYMHEMTTAICKNSTNGETAQLIDVRGQGSSGANKSATYGVRKIFGNQGSDDSECWMTDNLNLYDTKAGALTPDNTDIKSGTYQIPAPITATNQWNTNNYQTKKVEISHGMGQYADTSNQYGTWGEPYYNWTVAVAKETTEGITTAPDTSICPKGWTLPVNGTDTVAKSYAHLLAKAIPNTPITTGQQLISNSSTLGFTKYYGFWHWYYASEYDQGNVGVFWSGTPSTETNAYYLDYNSGAVDPQHTDNKYYGFGIRCVAR